MDRTGIKGASDDLTQYAAVRFLLHQQHQDIGENPIEKRRLGKGVGKGVRSDGFIAAKYLCHSQFDVGEQMRHGIPPAMFACAGQTEGMCRKKVGVRLNATLYVLKHPLYIRGKRGVGRAGVLCVKNILPDALNRCNQQILFAGKIVVKGTQCYMARLGHRAHIQRGKTVFRNDLATGLKNGFFGCYDRIDRTDLQSEQCSL